MIAWLVICMPWVPMSSTTIPMIRAASDVRPVHSSAKDPASRTPATTVVDGVPVRVGQLAGEVGGQNAARAHQSEEADDQIRVVVRLAREQEGQRRPQHAEGGEGAGAVKGPASQHGLVDQQAEGRSDEFAVAAVRAWSLRGQGPPEDHGEHHHQAGGEPVDRPPAGRLGHQSRHRAGQQNAQEQSRHDARHDAAPPLLGRQVGGEGDHDLPGDRGGADEDGRHGEDPQIRREGATDQGQRAEAEETGDELAPRVQVAQGDDEQQPGGVTDLRGRDDGRGRSGPRVERPGDLMQDRLRVVEVGHHRAGGDGDEDDEAPGHPLGSAVGCAPVPVVATGSGYRRPRWVRRCRRAGSRR